jgi:hypothetical protein
MTGDSAASVSSGSETLAARPFRIAGAGWNYFVNALTTKNGLLTEIVARSTISPP